VRSDLVVISWWSNSLGLACLHGLVERTRDREIYVIQAGKPAEQMERFRACLPPSVRELPYSPERSGEDWRVREAVARELLGDRDGLWFIDHDLFLQQDCEGWLADMDRRLETTNICLCHPAPQRGPSITNPAFWLSPVRFPSGMPSFARLPYQQDPVANRPYAPREERPGALVMPEKDTLVATKEFLQQRNMALGFPIAECDRAPGGPAPFPRFEHIGGLYTFAGHLPPEPLREWAARCVERFTAFYASCPQAWVDIEDPALLRRLEEFRQALSI
jgi:hypothetical protein